MATPDRPVNQTAFAIGVFLGSGLFLLLLLAINVFIPAWILMLLSGALASFWGVAGPGYWACVLFAVAAKLFVTLLTAPRPSSVR